MIVASEHFKREVEAKRIITLFEKTMKTATSNCANIYNVSGDLKALFTYFDVKDWVLLGEDGILYFRVGRFWFEIEYEIGNDKGLIVSFKTFDNIKDTRRKYAIDSPENRKPIPELDFSIIEVANGNKDGGFHNEIELKGEEPVFVSGVVEITFMSYCEKLIKYIELIDKKSES